MTDENKNEDVIVKENGLAEAIDRIADMARLSRETRIEPVPLERQGIYLVVGPDGKAERRLVESQWHDERLLAPTQLQAFVKERHADDDEGVVFINPTEMIYCYDREDRRDIAGCQFKRTAAWEWLLMADKPLGGDKLGQADFVRLLRITLRGCMGGDDLLRSVRTLKFNANAEASGDVQHGRESMGKSIETKISGLTTFPEEVTLTVQPFEEFGHRVRIECAVEIFPNESAFRLTPFPLEMKRGMEAVLENLAGLFDGDGFPPCYLGRP